MLPGRLLRPRLFVTIVPPPTTAGTARLAWPCWQRAVVTGWLQPTHGCCGPWSPDRLLDRADHLERDRELHALVLDLFRGVPRPAGPSRSQMLQVLIR